MKAATATKASARICAASDERIDVCEGASVVDAGSFEIINRHSDGSPWRSSPRMLLVAMDLVLEVRSWRERRKGALRSRLGRSFSTLRAGTPVRTPRRLAGRRSRRPTLLEEFVVCERLFTVSWSGTIFPLSPNPVVGARDAGAFCASLVGGETEPLGLPEGCAAAENARPAATTRSAALRLAVCCREHASI